MKPLSKIAWTSLGVLLLGLLVCGVPLGVPSTSRAGQWLKARAGRWPFWPVFRLEPVILATRLWWMLGRRIRSARSGPSER